jgi:hypothetical protein
MSKLEERLDIVALIDPTGELNFENIHPTHRKSMNRYGELGINYELRRNKLLASVNKSMVEVYRINPEDQVQTE